MRNQTSPSNGDNSTSTPSQLSLAPASHQKTLTYTHLQTLLDVLDEHLDIKPLFTQDIQDKAVAAWHGQTAWPDVPEALRKLKEERG